MAERGFRLFGGARTVGACTMASRVLGMVRDILCASCFGAAPEWDAFVIAFIIPNLFRRLFGEGALTAAFVPVFVDRLKNRGKKDAGNLLRSLVSVLSLVLLSVTALAMLTAFVLPEIHPHPKTILVCEYSRIMLPYLFLICTAAILGAALNSLNHFFAPAFAPVVLNALIIAAVLGMGPVVGAVAWAVLIGGVIELLLMMPPLLARGFNPLPRFDRQEEGLMEIGKLFFPVVFGLALVQINEVVDNIIAEVFVPGDGAVSVLYYANRLMQLPLAVVGTALATAVFPRFSFHASDPAAFSSALRKTVRSCLFLTLPATAGLWVLATPIIRLLFEHGRFGAEATARTELALIFFVAGISAYSLNQILVRAFYARKEMKTPVKVSASMVFANVILNLSLVGPLGEAGLALATAVTGTATTVVLYRLLKRRIPDLRLRLAGPLLRGILFSIVLAAGVWQGDRLLPEAVHAASFSDPALFWEAGRLLILVAGGAGIYFALEGLWKLRRSRS